MPFVDCAGYSFELGGEKKTKGAALQFVSSLAGVIAHSTVALTVLHAVIVFASSRLPRLAILTITAIIYHPRIM